jgi:hypothetical protein
MRGGDAMEPIHIDDPKHPGAHRLDAVAAGDADEGVRAHLATCEACARYVAELRDEAARFRASEDAGAFIARVQAPGSRGDSVPHARREGTPSATRIVRGSWMARAAFVAGPLVAAAALVLLVVRGRAPIDGAPPSPTESRVLERASQVRTVPPSDSRFKGGFAVAVVRERGGRQERLTGPFEVRGGDRVRLEVSIDHAAPVAAGLLTDQGEWVNLLSPEALEAGTHFSETAARFDESPTHATLLVGEPAAVEHARATRDFSGVVAWRVVSEALP